VGRLGGQEVRVADAVTPSSNGRVEICVRPERVRIGDAARDLANTGQGVVEDVVFGGSSTAVRLRLPSGETLASRTDATVRLDVGARVTYGWEPSAGVVLSSKRSSDDERNN
jgi:ABC-type Fe3+/spermidine/putrescine transport system ATPase subunit